jgi:hypothetical protein
MEKEPPYFGGATRGELGLELCPLLEPRLAPAELAPAEFPPPELLPEPAPEPYPPPLLERGEGLLGAGLTLPPPELGGGLLWTEPALPPLLPALAPEYDREGPGLEGLEFCKLSGAGTRRGCGVVTTPGEGEGAAGAEAAPGAETLLPPLEPMPALPPAAEPEAAPALGESRVMLGGNMRRGSGIRSRPEEGEAAGEAATPELLPPLLDAEPP